MASELLPFHANMFQAAVSASVPVQPLCIMYEDAHGRQSTAPAYIDDLVARRLAQPAAARRPVDRACLRVRAACYLARTAVRWRRKRRRAVDGRAAEMQGGAATSGALVAERAESSASTRR